MRKDLEQLLTRVEAQEAKQLSKKDYQRAFELVPESEFIMFAIPSQLKGLRGPLIVTNRHLMFVTGSGDHATIPLTDVHGTRYETIGMIKRKPFELYVTTANQELCFALAGASENSVLLFLELLDTAKNDLVSASASNAATATAVRQLVVYAIDGTDPLCFFMESAEYDDGVWKAITDRPTVESAAESLQASGWHVDSIAPTGDGRTAMHISA